MRCPRCQGTGRVDEGEWTCWSCGKRVFENVINAEAAKMEVQSARRSKTPTKLP